jgi:hypothetical protein
MASLTAKNHNKDFQPFVERLKRKRKLDRVIICAVMRKLMHIFYGILKNNKDFDDKLAFSI